VLDEHAVEQLEWNPSVGVEGIRVVLSEPESLLLVPSGTGAPSLLCLCETGQEEEGEEDEEDASGASHPGLRTESVP
jgi:hypothetical protein